MMTSSMVTRRVSTGPAEGWLYRSWSCWALIPAVAAWAAADCWAALAPGPPKPA